MSCSCSAWSPPGLPSAAVLNTDSVIEARALNPPASTADILGQVILCVVGCLAPSLASTRWMPVASSHHPPPCDKKKCLYTLLTIPWGQSYPQLGTTGLGSCCSQNLLFQRYLPLPDLGTFKFVARVNCTWLLHSCPWALAPAAG